MKCLVLAAGYATRLYPLIKDFPKPLLTVKGKAILDWLLDDLDATRAVEEYIIISNHRFAEHFENWAKRRRASGERITVLDDGTTSNETRLGAVRDIQFAVEALKLDEDLLVIAGDNLLNFSLARFIDYTKMKNASCIMRFYEPALEKLRKTGVAVVNEDDLIIDMEEKPEHPKSHWCTPPFYYYTKQDVPLIEKGIAAECGTDAPGSFMAWLSGQTKVYAMQMPGRRYDIGNMESYRMVQIQYEGIL